MIDLYGEENCKSILSSFVCPLSKDVEDFIHNKAINFAMQRIAITFLVFLEKDERLFLMGYYTLSNKFVSVSNNMLSKIMQKRIAKFAQYDSDLKRYLISMPLIVQLGRNFIYNKDDTGFTEADLLELACKRIIQVQKNIGGKMTYIECASNPKLYEFYSNHDFLPFGQRNKEKYELTEGAMLVQMLRYFKS
ncbi:MAG: N-acetyltransferase [Ruminococcus flavefaciens]|nr:N-acetyltransferase [Ruminococcus flavefaciens]